MAIPSYLNICGAHPVRWLGGLALSLAVLMAAPPPAQTALALETPDSKYVPGVDSLPQAGVPKGTTLKLTLRDSRLYPGTERVITVYVPAQYTGKEPACVYVGLDGLSFSAATVFDNLIARKELPVIIGIGLNPGAVASSKNPKATRYNRSVEFDSVNHKLAQFLEQEVLPEVERQRTADGRPILLSKNPSDRAAGGASAGGIAAFTLAWSRPDLFRRVFSAIGTYVGMRGGDAYPVLVRKTEPKPLRVYLQDGSNDQWTGGPEYGDWWMSNQTLERALEFAGYDVTHVWGDGPHSSRHATAVFPEAQRWLWRDWPQPVIAGTSRNTVLKAILPPGSNWEEVPGLPEGSARLEVDPAGRVLVDQLGDATGWVIDASGAVTRREGGFRPRPTGAFGPDGRWFEADTAARKIVASTPGSRKRKTIARNILATNLLVTPDAKLYATDHPAGGEGGARLWLVQPDGTKKLLDEGLGSTTGLALSPDGLWLALAEGTTSTGYSYRVASDGTVDAKQKYYTLHVPKDEPNSGMGTWIYDREGRLYAATRMGVQVLDRNGRSRAILPVPEGEVLDICFGGEDLSILYVATARHVYRRRLLVPGKPGWSAPIPLPPGSIG